MLPFDFTANIVFPRRSQIEVYLLTRDPGRAGKTFQDRATSLNSGGNLDGFRFVPEKLRLRLKVAPVRYLGNDIFLIFVDISEAGLLEFNALKFNLELSTEWPVVWCQTPLIYNIITGKH